jgi:hypothetical protein
MRRRDSVIRCSSFLRFLLVPLFFTLLLFTVSCGDFQDPASGSLVQSGSSGTELINPSTSESGENPAGHDDGRAPRSTDVSALGLFAAGSPGETRSVTLGWDPSSSEGVLGYKVYLIAVSTAVEQIIDVGQATSVAVPLKLGESYGFTVTAYNSSWESQSLPYLLFHVDPLPFPPTSGG